MKIRFLPFSLVFFLLVSSVFALPYHQTKVHHVVGFYPTDRNLLARDIDDYFGKARKYFGVSIKPNSVKALIAPHAGYIFSGLSAASVYQTLFEQIEGGFAKNKKIKKVVILALSHSGGFTGIALPDYAVYETPLGGVNVDEDAVEQLRSNSLFRNIVGAHEGEHSLEVQLPFLQCAIEDFTIVPLIIGGLADRDFDSVADVLKKIIDDETLVVVSSDFTHHGPRYGYKKFANNSFYNVRRLDSSVIEPILEKSYAGCADLLKKTGATVCGRTPIKLLLKLIERGVFGEVEGRLASYYTSAQIDRARRNGFDVQKLFENVPDDPVSNSVSYAGIIFTTQKTVDLLLKDQMTGYEQRALLQSARDSIENAFRTGKTKLDQNLLAPVLTPMLKKNSGAFVTLKKKNGELRGCIGDVLPSRPLYQAVLARAQSAAFEDTRFSPLKRNELDNIIVDITVLESPRKVASRHEIVFGKHGMILKNGGRSALFLPQVAEMFDLDPDKTLGQLSLKAGLSQNAYKQPETTYEVFEGFEFKEECNHKTGN